MFELAVSFEHPSWYAAGKVIANWCLVAKLDRKKNNNKLNFFFLNINGELEFSVFY